MPLPMNMNKRKSSLCQVGRWDGSVGPKSTGKESLLDPVCRRCHGAHVLFLLTGSFIFATTATLLQGNRD